MKHLPKIIFSVVPHGKCRNYQCDDYYRTKGGWRFMVSKMNARYEFLILIHALVEWFICEMNGIREKAITAFDRMFEAERAAGKWTNEEPGDDSRCPYQIPHKIATGVEMLLAPAVGVDWKEYTIYINKL